MLSVDDKLSFETIAKIFKTGYSRIPVYEVSRDNVIGLLFVKDLIFIDPEDEVPIRSFIQIFGRGVHVVWPDDTLGDVLAELKQGKTHLALVRDVNNVDESQDPFYEVKGIITLEGAFTQTDDSSQPNENSQISSHIQISLRKSLATRLSTRQMPMWTMPKKSRCSVRKHSNGLD